MTDITKDAAEFVDVADFSELVPDEGRIVQVAGNWIALFLADGVPYAIDNACPHMAGPLGSGSCSDGIVTCPIHGWRFDVRTGCAPTNPNTKVARYDACVVNGRVLVRVTDDVEETFFQ